MNEGFIPLLIVVFIAFYTDLTTKRIPNALCLIAACLGYVTSILSMGWSGILFSTAGLCAGFIIMWVIYLFKGIGAGDVKLMAGLGSMLGLNLIIQLIVLSFIIAGVIGVILLGYQFICRLKNVEVKQVFITTVVAETKTKHQFPFMLAITPAAALLIIL